MIRNSVILLCLPFLACTSRPPAVDVTFWSANSQVGGIQRPQEGKVISCKSEEFDQYACVSYPDVSKLFKAFLQCKQWAGPVMTQHELKKAYKKNQPVVDVIAHMNR